MGRHSAPRQTVFYRSVASWVVPWVLIAAVTGVSVWFAVDALGGSALEASPNPSPTRTSRTAAAAPTPTAAPSPVETEPPAEPRTDPGTRRDVKLITDGVTVQVLNGTATPAADDLMADRLAALGFSVVSVESSSKAYADTTVFWSTGDAEAAAEALARRFGWIAQPKPGNLSDEVSLHVVVGADEAG